MTFTFESFTVGDYGIEMVFLRGTDRYTIHFTFAELDTFVGLPALLAAVQSRLRRKLQGEGYSSKLQPLLGGTVTI